jgi:leucyl aminopeptidase
MKVTLSTDALTKVRADLLAIGVKQGGLGSDKTLKALDKAANGAISAAAKLDEFTGKSGETLKVQVGGRLATRTLLLVGLGDAAFGEKEARALVVRAAGAGSKYGTVAIALPADGDEILRAAAEGAVMGTYRYTRYLTGERLPKRTIQTIRLVSSRKDKKASAALDAGVAVGEAINLVRDLVNAPPNDLTPTALANEAEKACEPHGVSFQSWDKEQLQKLGAELFLAVNRGSAEAPRMVHLGYKPENVANKKKIVFVGKGLTFDSGGLCIKPAAGMGDMKCDMAGAAATIGIILAAARLKLPIEVHGLFGATENMTGSAAYRPGDVFKSLEGKTVEIINTDAEGRLVLADVLAYAVKNLQPDYLIDHATLTGACVVALGPWTAGLFANDDELANAYQKAAGEVGESFWRMPLSDDLREMLKSDIADLKHMGDRMGGSITAALFLREFIGKTKWMHLDIAGPAFLDRSHGLMPKGGTGFGVATGVRFLEALAASGS